MIDAAREIGERSAIDRRLAEATTPAEVHKTVFEIDQLLDIARAVGTALEQVNELQIFRIRGIRRGGALLKELPRGKPPGKRREILNDSFSISSPYKQGYEDAQLTPQMASFWQRIAAIPQDIVDDYQDECIAGGSEISLFGQLVYYKKRIQAQQRQRRVQEVVDLSEAMGTYPVICADPPWCYEYTETESRAIENQYPTMELGDICALSVGKIAASDAVLFMWATSPKLAEAMRVIEAWGFTYRTCAVWVKDKIGTGYYFRQRHELLLVATRGELPVPEPSDRYDSVIEAARLEHSAKPTTFYEVIESMYPEYRRIELFSRNRRDGWEGWGNQYGSA